jgi:pSer/pThr/pTyr-binding forkhead associated (FHA) protein
MADKSILFVWNDPATGDPIERWVTLPATMGRSNDNKLRLRSDAISRQHAWLGLVDGKLMLRDERSTNGTYLNGHLVTETPVKLGDTIYLGPFLLSLAEERDIAAEDIEERRVTSEFPNVEVTARPTTSLSMAELQRMMQEAAQAPPTTPTEDESAEAPPMGVPAPPTGQEGTMKMSREELLARMSQLDSLKELSNEVLHIDRVEQTADDLPDLLQAEVVPMATLKAQKDAPVDEITYLSLGAGVGSFVWVDYLRVCGVPKDAIRTIGFETRPLERYRRLCLHSQIPDHERLRSDSGSTPDNIWGYPGYAMREIVTSALRGKIVHAGKIGWQIFTEPLLSDSYTPIAGRVYASVDREAERIGWDDMTINGRIRALRKTDDGRYVAYYTTVEGDEPRYMVGRYVHLALGYPGFQLLPDLKAYREATGDFTKIVNAYEPHDHVYETLGKEGGTVLLRGRGIVASRLIQRVYEARLANPDQEIRIIHLLRSPLPEGHQYAGNKRLVENHWELQPYNWPKAAFGGDLKFLLEDSHEEVRDQLLNDWGGTTTADRQDWRDIISTGIAEGWYEIRFGAVSEVKQGAQGNLETVVSTRAAQMMGSIFSDFVIDATGLNADLRFNPLLKDMLEIYGVPLNIKGRIETDNCFEVQALRNGDGRLFVVGAISFGNGYAPVDSFVGLQYAAGRTMETLRASDSPNLKNLNPLRSLGQYIRWMRGVQP